MVLNFKAGRYWGFIIGPFIQILILTVIFVYLIMEVGFFAVDEEKSCFLGHLFGFLSGIIVGFIVLDNRKEKAWVSITRRILITIYMLVFICMVLLSMMRNVTTVEKEVLENKKMVVLNMTSNVATVEKEILKTTMIHFVTVMSLGCNIAMLICIYNKKNKKLESCHKK